MLTRVAQSRFGDLMLPYYLRQEFGRVFRTQRHTLQLPEDLLVPFEIVGFLQEEKPYQPLDVYAAKSWVWKFEDCEVTLQRRMCAAFVRKNLHYNIRQS